MECWKCYRCLEPAAVEWRRWTEAKVGLVCVGSVEQVDVSAAVPSATAIEWHPESQQFIWATRRAFGISLSVEASLDRIPGSENVVSTFSESCEDRTPKT